MYQVDPVAFNESLEEGEKEIIQRYLSVCKTVRENIVNGQISTKVSEGVCIKCGKTTVNIDGIAYHKGDCKMALSEGLEAPRLRPVPGSLPVAQCAYEKVMRYKPVRRVRRKEYA